MAAAATKTGWAPLAPITPALWGSNLCVTVPPEVRETLDFSDDEVELAIQGSSLAVTPKGTAGLGNGIRRNLHHKNQWSIAVKLPSIICEMIGIERETVLDHEIVGGATWLLTPRRSKV
jgi:antitoxin component of MazEF toxin-antitoxin module